jgi:hypothetical protein
LSINRFGAPHKNNRARTETPHGPMPTENTTVYVRGDTYRKLRERKEETEASSFTEVIDEVLDEG